MPTYSTHVRLRAHNWSPGLNVCASGLRPHRNRWASTFAPFPCQGLRDTIAVMDIRERFYSHPESSSRGVEIITQALRDFE